MHIARKLFFSLLYFFCFTTCVAENQSNVDFDFDAMDTALTESGIEQTIHAKAPSRIEVLLKRLAAPIIVRCINGYSYLKEKNLRIVALMKTVFKRKTREKNHEQQQQ